MSFLLWAQKGIIFILLLDFLSTIAVGALAGYITFQSTKEIAPFIADVT